MKYQNILKIPLFSLIFINYMPWLVPSHSGKLDIFRIVMGQYRCSRYSVVRELPNSATRGQQRRRYWTQSRGLDFSFLLSIWTLLLSCEQLVPFVFCYFHEIVIYVTFITVEQCAFVSESGQEQNMSLQHRTSGHVNHQLIN